jgi:phosphomannomutase
MIDYSGLKSGTDIRGQALGDAVLLDRYFAVQIGAAFVAWLSDKKQLPSARLTVAIGRDSRITGESLMASCAEGMSHAGAHVLVFGLCTTPAMYMSIITPGYEPDAAVMVTASHHPPDRNGFKFFTASGGISGDDISAILERAGSDAMAAEAAGLIEHRDFLEVYQEQLMARVRLGLDAMEGQPLSGLHVAVDAGNGAGGFYADMLARLGANVNGSRCLEPDGRFPFHIPNPENDAAMASVREAVLTSGADLGVIFDADCDRAAIVDGNGQEINRNRLIALISAILLEKVPGATIVTDSVTSSGLGQFIAEWGGIHYRFKRGYRNVIDEAIRLNSAGIDCPLAIETSGHAAFRENHFLDDGMYLVTVLICEAMRMKKAGRQLSGLLDGLREPEESVELRLAIHASDFRGTGRAAIDKVIGYASACRGCHIAPDNREGVRISFDLAGGFDNGWFLLRLSLHDPVLPLNVESDVPGGIAIMLGSLYTVLADFEGIDLDPIRACLPGK